MSSVLNLGVWIVAAVCSFYNASYDPAHLRNSYAKATKNEEAGISFHEHMRQYKENEPVVLGYKAASEAVMAKYCWSPYSKLKHLKTSSEIFNKAVKLAPANPEIRFLRYTVEYYIPRYLNMSSHVEEDKKVFLESVLRYPNSGVDRNAAVLMRSFLLSEKENHCTESEKQKLQQVKI
ncbi:MAG: hypothetical protein LPJ89_01665 [Hymenobacteraceae bacterium]|nr:hypothetical protein [Hymenobacteraceae bacterium]MDX5396488.1 hypothetical protein [Hymenobacteraceae bacterium]MDX5442470.1 hypothetical protein [Hymenobacteraceae bacterium]MDX5512546.1 hypothetical protein [Hymenobacteraceae bacterium]